MRRRRVASGWSSGGAAPGWRDAAVAARREDDAAPAGEGAARRRLTVPARGRRGTATSPPPGLPSPIPSAPLPSNRLLLHLPSIHRHYRLAVLLHRTPVDGRSTGGRRRAFEEEHRRRTNQGEHRPSLPVFLSPYLTLELTPMLCLHTLCPATATTYWSCCDLPNLISRSSCFCLCRFF
jgi:hypothetical protein